MISPLFYLFATMMIVGGLMVVFMRNPVSSALSMVLSFIGLAGIFIGLNAYFVGILQILVYAGAIMVLFIFIIMLLDLQKEESYARKGVALAAGVLIPVVLLIQLAGVLASDMDSPKAPELKLKEAAADYGEEEIIHKRLADDRLPDVHLIGRKLFTEYNFPLQIIAVLLLVATVGCVALSKKPAAPISKNLTKKRVPTVPHAPAPVKSEPAVEKIPAEPIEEVASDTSTDEKLGLIYTSKPDDVDDLKVISGVGPLLESKLNDFGVYTYKQVADWSEANIEEFDNLLSFKGRITRDNWLTQAAELHAKKNT